jgi:hypothetical protein
MCTLQLPCAPTRKCASHNNAVFYREQQSSGTPHAPLGEHVWLVHSLLLGSMCTSMLSRAPTKMHHPFNRLLQFAAIIGDATCPGLESCAVSQLLVAWVDVHIAAASRPYENAPAIPTKPLIGCKYHRKCHLLCRGGLRSKTFALCTSLLHGRCHMYALAFHLQACTITGNSSCSAKGACWVSLLLFDFSFRVLARSCHTPTNQKNYVPFSRRKQRCPARSLALLSTHAM